MRSFFLEMLPYIPSSENCIFRARDDDDDASNFHISWRRFNSTLLIMLAEDDFFMKNIIVSDYRIFSYRYKKKVF